MENEVIKTTTLDDGSVVETRAIDPTMVPPEFLAAAEFAEKHPVKYAFQQMKKVIRSLKR